MADADADRELRIVRRFEAPRDLVFRAWTERDMLSRWFGPTDVRITRCDVDAQVGGGWLVTMTGATRTHTVSGKFLEIAPPSRLSFTWAWHETADPATPREHETIVTVDLAERGTSTEMTFVQRLFRDRQGRDNHNTGWTSSFVALDRLLAGSEPKDL